MGGVSTTERADPIIRFATLLEYIEKKGEIGFVESVAHFFPSSSSHAEHSASGYFSRK